MGQFILTLPKSQLKLTIDTIGGRVRIQTLPGMARPNHPQTPNPGILTDLTTKARKCDSQHLITKVCKCPFLRVSDYVWGMGKLLSNFVLMGYFGG